LNRFNRHSDTLFSTPERIASHGNMISELVKINYCNIINAASFVWFDLRSILNWSSLKQLSKYPIDHNKTSRVMPRIQICLPNCNSFVQLSLWIVFSRSFSKLNSHLYTV